MQNYIIECRNQDAVQNTNNGDWETLVQDKVFLEEGDTIICRNSYIDTKAQSDGKIILEDTTLTLNFLSYKMNWNGVVVDYTDGTWSVPPWGSVPGGNDASVINAINYEENITLPCLDGEPYVMCKKHTPPDGAEIVNMTGFFYSGAGDLHHLGEFDVAIVYVGIDGTVQFKTYYLPEHTTFTQDTYTVATNILYNKNLKPSDIPGFAGPEFQDPIQMYLVEGGDPYYAGGRVDNTQQRNPTGGSAIPPTPFHFTYIERCNDPEFNHGVSGTEIYEPVESSVKVFVPKGNYDPAELCEYVNEELTKAQGTPENLNLANNPLLQGVGGDANDDNNNFIQLTDSQDLSQRKGISIQAAARIVGASQFVLTYKPDQNRFSFQYLHTPIYSNADGSNASDAELSGWGVAQQYAQPLPAGLVPVPGPINPDTYGDTTQPLSPDKHFSCDRDGGIIFTSLSPSTFWEDQLGFITNPLNVDLNGKPTGGFNPLSICTSYTVGAGNEAGEKWKIGQFDESIPVFDIKPSVGRQMTAGFNGINTTFVKDSNWQNYSAMPQSNWNGTPGNIMATIEQQTFDITALNKSTISTGSTTFGYFLIEVTAGFSNNFLTPRNNHAHIAAIVSRYYEKDSYTLSTSADSIVYVHSGAPQLLSSFKCRVLDSNKNVAIGLGKDNTVFMQVIKADKSLKKALKN
tara:strand:+ start:1322 stop:3379 length:2058 start_codon:yes stop_codon:yes gene_type:complete